MAVDAGDIGIVAASDMLGVTLGLVVEGAVLVAIAAVMASFLKSSMDVMAYRTGDAVLDGSEGRER